VTMLFRIPGHWVWQDLWSPYCSCWFTQQSKEPDISTSKEAIKTRW